MAAAKPAADAPAGTAGALLTSAATTAVALPWPNPKGPSASAPDGGLGRAPGGTPPAAGLCGLVGVGVGAPTRNQVAAPVAVLVGALAVQGLLLSLLNAPSLGKWLPSAAAAALTTPAGGHLPRWAAGPPSAAYGHAFAMVGTRIAIPRDIT